MMLVLFFPILAVFCLTIFIVPVFSTVIDMNDNAPKFEQTSYTCWLSEEATRGQLVTLVSANDPDVGHLQYSIAAGNQHHTFAIDAETGYSILFHSICLTMYL